MGQENKARFNNYWKNGIVTIYFFKFSIRSLGVVEIKGARWFEFWDWLWKEILMKKDSYCYNKRYPCSFFSLLFSSKGDVYRIKNIRNPFYYDIEYFLVETPHVQCQVKLPIFLKRVSRKNVSLVLQYM